MTAQKQTSKSQATRNDGKKVSGNLAMDKKKPSKYTLWRSKEDVKKLREVRMILKLKNFKEYKTDSKLYRELVDEFLDAVKTIGNLRCLVTKLTAKERDLREISGYVCRIIDITKRVNE